MFTILQINANTQHSTVMETHATLDEEDNDELWMHKIKIIIKKKHVKKR